MPGTRRKPGRLGPYVEGYRSWLLELGYSPLTVTHSLTALGHLGRWMARGHVEVETLDGDAVRAFLAAYVRDRGRLPTASVRPLDYLRAQGVVAPESAAPMSALERLLAEYREWMLGARGLAATTVRVRVGLARRFLAQRACSANELGIERLTGSDVTGFLLGECARVKSGTLDCHADHLRSLLRFLGARGLADPGLAQCVPSVGGWRDAGIPQVVTGPQVELLLGSCDRSTVVGVRDLAILMLLARLGLRAVEVSRLELGDLHWRAGEADVDGKGPRARPAAAPRRCRRGTRGVSAPARSPREPPRVLDGPRADAAARARWGEICRARRVPTRGHRARRGSPAAPRAGQRAVARRRVADRHRPGAAPQAP
jgi:integrase